MKRIALFFVILVLVMQVAQTVGAQEAKSFKSTKELSAEFHSTKDPRGKYRLSKALRHSVRSVKDLEMLMDMAHSSKDKTERKLILSSLKELRVKEDAKEFEPFFLKTLDDSDMDMRTMAIANLGVLKSRAAAPKLRKIVKRFGGIKSAALRVIDSEKAAKKYYEAGYAAMALGEMKDEESIPLLADRLYDLDEFGYEALGSMGKKALPYILNLARKEKDYEKSYAHSALARIRDREARQDLIEIVKNERDVRIRGEALRSLVAHMYGEDVLEVAKSIYEKEGRFFGSAMKTKQAIPFLTHVLLHGQRNHDREYAAMILEDVGDATAVPALEEALKDGDPNVRRLAAIALERITGKEYPWKKQPGT